MKHNSKDSLFTSYLHLSSIYINILFNIDSTSQDVAEKIEEKLQYIDILFTSKYNRYLNLYC